MSRRRSSKSPSQPPSPATARLFTEKDEIDILKSLLNFAGNSIPVGHFSKSQIADKIRRLKQKYHRFARSNSSIKTPHDRSIYEIARKIWGKEKTSTPSPTPMNEDRKEKASGSSREGMINWSDFPFLMREVSRAFPGNEELYKEGLKGLGEDILKGLDEKWKELEMEGAAIQARKAYLRWNLLKSEVSNSKAPNM